MELEYTVAVSRMSGIDKGLKEALKICEEYYLDEMENLGYDQMSDKQLRKELKS